MEFKQQNSIYPSSQCLVCRVCGDVARGNNFQVPTCMSCKSFFRRNALQQSGALRCCAGNKCLVTKKTRNRCQACRLRKCFESGMNPKLIRQINNQRIIHTNITDENYFGLSQCQSLNFCQENYSDRCLQQQLFFSNLFYVFDQTKSNYISSFSSLPPKLRFKSARKLDMMNTVLEQSYDLTTKLIES